MYIHKGNVLKYSLPLDGAKVHYDDDPGDDQRPDPAASDHARYLPAPDSAQLHQPPPGDRAGTSPRDRERGLRCSACAVRHAGQL